MPLGLVANSGSEISKWLCSSFSAAHDETRQECCTSTSKYINKKGIFHLLQEFQEHVLIGLHLQWLLP